MSWIVRPRARRRMADGASGMVGIGAWYMGGRPLCAVIRQWLLRIDYLLYVRVIGRVHSSSLFSASYSPVFMGGVNQNDRRENNAEETTMPSTPRQLSSSAVPKENHVHNALAAVKNNVPAMRRVHCRCDNPMKVLLPYLQWFTVAYSDDAGSRLVLGKGAGEPVAGCMLQPALSKLRLHGQ